MKRVGLLIAYKNPNYGTMLQAFATQYIVESLGCETEIIDYTADRFNKHYPLDLGLFRFLIDAYHPWTHAQAFSGHLDQCAEEFPR